MPKWKLIDQDTGAELAIGDERTTFGNEPVKIDSLQAPDQPDWMGRVYVRFGDGSKSHGLFPGVVDAEFVESTSERSRVEKEALSGRLFDAAFAMISYNTFHSRFGPPPHPRPINLMTLKARFSESEIDDACRRVNALLQDADQAGDDLNGKRSTYSEVSRRLRERYPGFSDKCYDEALRQGRFNAR